MADNALADDLFGEDADDSGQPSRLPSPVASSSKTPASGVSQNASPAPQAAAPVKAESLTGNGEAQGSGDVDDLFGDEEDGRARGRSSTATSEKPPSEQSLDPLEYAEQDADQEDVPACVVLAFPQFPHMKASDGKIWDLRLPAYINLESKPYDPGHYRATLKQDKLDPKDVIGAKSRMLQVGNTIRWRWVTGPDGEPMRQSNARMLRWSDGSMSLQVGADLYDVQPSAGTTLARASDPAPTSDATSQSQVPPAAQPVSRISTTTFLCYSSFDEGVLQTDTAIAGQLTLLPASRTSQSHLELVKHVGQQHVKHSRMKLLDDLEDKSQMQQLLMKASGLEKAPKGKSNRKSGVATGGRSKKRDSDDEEARYDRRSPRPRGRRSEQVEEADYDDDDGFIVADDDDDDEQGGHGDEDEDTDEAEYGKKGKKKSSSSTTTPKGRKRRGEELDEMEEAERRIEKKERERKRAKKEVVGASKKKSKEYVSSEEGEEDAEGDEDVEMNIESEEDD